MRPHRLVGPGHEIFILVTGVRIPLGTPIFLSHRAFANAKQVGSKIKLSFQKVLTMEKSYIQKGELRIISSAITLIIMYYTQSFHHLPVAYGPCAALVGFGYALGAANKWTLYAAGIITGYALFQSGTFSTASLTLSYDLESWAPFATLVGFLIFSIYLADAIEYAINKYNA